MPWPFKAPSSAGSKSVSLHTDSLVMSLDKSLFTHLPPWSPPSAMPSPEPTKLSAQWLARNVGRTAGTETGYFFLACAFRVIDVVILGWPWYFSEVLLKFWFLSQILTQLLIDIFLQFLTLSI